MPAKQAAPFQELQAALGELQQDNLNSDSFNTSQGGVVEGQQPMSLPDYIQMQEDKANAQNEYVQKNPNATPDAKGKAAAEYSKAMASVKYMRDNPEATAVQDRLAYFNDPKGATSRANLEGRGSDPLTADLLGIGSATGFGADDMQQTSERQNVLNSQFTHLQRASALNNESLRRDPKNAQLLARRTLYQNKAKDIQNEAANMGPSEAETYTYLAGTMLSPEDAGVTYGSRKLLKPVGRAAKKVLSPLKNKVLSSLPNTPAPKASSKGAAKLAPTLTSGAGKVLGLAKPVSSALGIASKIGTKAIVPLTIAEAAYSGGQAAFGSSPEAEANREMHRKQAETGESLAFASSRDPNMSKKLYALQETIKAVNPVRAAAQLGTLRHDVTSTAGQYIKADAPVRQAMREGVAESLANNAFYKAQGGEKGWAQDVGDYYAGPNWQKEDVNIANPEAAALNRQRLANRKRIDADKQLNIKSTMETAKKKANTRTPAQVPIGDKA
jgi:hypothetical protein